MQRRDRMKKASKIDLVNGMVTLDDGSQKTIDNYILELEDRFIVLQELLKDFEDVEPTSEYLVTGEMLFNIMDIIEGT